MTPLAQKLARHLLLPPAQRPAPWDRGSDAIINGMQNTQFFEITEVLPLLETVKKLPQDEFAKLLFLPAQQVWIEYEIGGVRFGVILLEDIDVAHAGIFTENSFNGNMRLSLCSDDVYVGAQEFPEEYLPASYLKTGRDVTDWIISLLAFAHMALPLINSPKIIGRQQQMMHKGLRRKLMRTPLGRWPLEGWSELQLEATPTYVDESGDIHEARLTGKKCLHFCRKHLRVKNGKLEIVNSHWRGDPGLGIKRTRYKIVPPKGQPKTITHEYV